MIKMMKNVNFKYWTDMCHCMGANVGGECSMRLTEEELQLFSEANKKAIAEGADDILAYFEEALPEELAEKIADTIYDDVNRNMAEDALCSCGEECFPNMSSEEYCELSREELIDRLIEESEPFYDYCIVEIKFLD